MSWFNTQSPDGQFFSNGKIREIVFLEYTLQQLIGIALIQGFVIPWDEFAQYRRNLVICVSGFTYDSLQLVIFNVTTLLNARGLLDHGALSFLTY